MKKANLFICEDDPGVREALKLILSDDYDLTFTTNGVEGLKALKKMNPDLIIMDIKMPLLGGLDILPKVKRIKRRTPVLMISGYESHDVAAEATRKGANDYLVKPFDRFQIRVKIENLLSLKKKRLW